MSLPFSQALFDVDEVYTLEERIEQQEIKDESLETKKKKKKKKKATSPVENKTPDERIDNKIAGKKSSLLVPSNEVLNAPSKETYHEEGISSIATDRSVLHAVSASKSDSLPNTEFLPSNDVKAQFLHSAVPTDCDNSEGNSERYSVCDHSMDTSDDESSTPSAKALSIALQTAILPFVHAEGSLTEDKLNAAGKCSPKQHKDSGQANVNDDLILDDSDSLGLICTSTSGPNTRETNALVSDVDFMDGEMTNETQQYEFEEKKKQEAVNRNILLCQTDQNNDIIHAVSNSKNLGISPSITKQQHFVISADAHKSDVTILEDGISVDTNSVGNTLEHETAEFSDVKENSVVFEDGSLLVNENNGIRHKGQQEQLRNDREQNERSAETNRDSPLIELECSELGEIESDQSQNNDEDVPKEVIHGVSSLFASEAESFGMKCATEEEKNEESSHVKVKSEYNKCDVEPSGNLCVFGMTQLQSERMKGAVADTEAGSMDVPKSVRNNTSVMKQLSTEIETVSQFGLKIVEPLKAENENNDRPTKDCEDTETLEIRQGVTLEGSKLAGCERSSSTNIDDGLADTTSSFNLQGSQVSKSLQQVQTYPTLCATAEATCSKTVEMHFPSFLSSSSVDLQTDPNEETNGTPMALNIATESYSTLTVVSDDADINQGLRDHEVGGTQQVCLNSSPSNHEVLSGEGKYFDLTYDTLEHSVFVSGKQLRGSDNISRENVEVSSDEQCSPLEPNSDDVLFKDEGVSLSTRLPANNREENECRQDGSKEFGHYDEQLVEMPEKQCTRSSETGQNVTQLSETEVSLDYAIQYKDDKPDNGELSRSLESQCSNSSPHKGNAETFGSVDNERDSNTCLCAEVNLPESGNGQEDVSQTIGFNSSSEHMTTKSSAKPEGKDFSEKNGGKLTRDNVITEEQMKHKARVPITNRIDGSKRGEDEDKEEGEITSDEEDTRETNKENTKKEREEGELSSSDSDKDVSPHEKRGGASVPRNELTQNRSVFSRKEKELCAPRRHSLSGVPRKVSDGSSTSERTASLSFFKKTDLRTKLSEARRTRSSMKSRTTGEGNETRGGRPRETPPEKRLKMKSTVEKPRQRKSVRDSTKTGNKANVNNSKPQLTSQVKRRETRQRSTGASNETKPGSNLETTESNLNFVNERKGKCGNSLQGDDGKSRNASPLTSRQKTDDSFDMSQVGPNKTSKDSTVFLGTRGNRETRKSRSDQRHATLKVKENESTINLERKTGKDSRVVSRPKHKTDACSKILDSQKASSRVEKEKTKINTTAKPSLNEPDRHRNESCIKSSLRPHSDNETIAKKVLTHSKSDDKKGRDEKTSSALLISEGKVQNKPENSYKATVETKTMDRKHVQSDKDKSKKVKIPVKASPRITPRKVLKKSPSNVTSKAKVQARRADKDKLGTNRKRSRAVDITELRHAKKMRLEEGNDRSSKLLVDASTTEKSKPSTKRGEYNNRESPPCFKLGLSEEVVPPGGEKLMDDPKTSSYNRTLSKTLLIGGNKCLVFKQRHVNQLFIRGDNVVMVAYAK